MDLNRLAFLLLMGSFLGVACKTKDPQPQPSERWKITHYQTTNSPLPSDYVRALALDANGGIWMATLAGNIFDDLVYLSPDRSTWEVYSFLDGDLPAEASITDLVVAPDGKVWAGTDDAGLLMFDGNNWTQINAGNANFLDGDGIADLEIDDQGRLWASVYSGIVPYDYFGLLLYDPNTQTAQKFTVDNSPLLSNAVEDLFLTDDGEVWIACSPGFHPFNTQDSFGVQLFDGGNWTSWNPANAPFIDKWFKQIYKDPGGDVWIENYTPPSGTPYNWGNHYLFSGAVGNWTQASELSGRSFRFATDGNGRSWITATHNPVKFGEPFTGGTWVLLEDGSYHSFNDTLPITDRKVLAPDPDNGMWIGTSKGLFWVRE